MSPHKKADWKPGIKIGPAQDWKKRLEDSHAHFVEIWYRVDWAEKYTGMLEYLKKHDIRAGMHFWGILPGNIQPNLAYPDPQIWQPSLEIIKRNLDVASKNGMHYVNIHMGTASLENMNLDVMEMTQVPNSIVALGTAFETMRQSLEQLQPYAESRKVRLLVETIPACVPASGTPEGYLNPHKVNALPSTMVEDLAKQIGFGITNDFCHTVGELIGQPREAMWQFLLDRTTAMAPYTELIHMNTSIEPFNGADSHNGILETDFAQNVFPNRDQITQLLNLFQNRDDLWVVGEPEHEHVANYYELLNFL